MNQSNSSRENSPTQADLIQLAHQWASNDPDEETRAHLEALITSAQDDSSPNEQHETATAELHDRFYTRLAFGTAGLRAELGPGPNRMNRVVVIQTAAGIAKWLTDTGAQGPVVIGYDGRKNSDVFARDSAEILQGAGIDAILLPRMLPTPVLAFAVQKYRAVAGIMVTASHNPPRDNGYKVYLGAADGGGQIVPPVDGMIAAAIVEKSTQPLAELPRNTNYRIAEEEVVTDYISATAALLQSEKSTEETEASPIRWVYTAMHGVGWETTETLIDELGWERPTTVDEQLHPDPNFSTVSFPNPEEPGALDLAFAKAESVNAELIVAHDPDADRLGVAIPDSSGGYRRLTGNEVGTILGLEIAERAKQQNLSGTLAVSLVSSPALKQVAAQYNLDYVETPTGFKWIVQQPNLLYGYEEALGYLVQPDVVSDKDGISAALLFLQIANRLKASGQTIADALEQFAQKFGYYASGQVSIRVDDLSDISRYMDRLRKTPPSTIAGIDVISAEDLLHPAHGNDEPADILRYQLADGSRVIARPSGTEPKLKVYLDVQVQGSDYAAQVAEGAEKLEQLGSGVDALLGR